MRAVGGAAIRGFLPDRLDRKPGSSFPHKKRKEDRVGGIHLPTNTFGQSEAVAIQEAEESSPLLSEGNNLS